jgi:hypothetical protein
MVHLELNSLSDVAAHYQDSRHTLFHLLLRFIIFLLISSAWAV